MEAELDSYEEYVKEDEAELTRLEAKPDKDNDDLAQIKKLNDRLFGLGGTNEDRRTHGSRTWVDMYASGQRARFAQQRKELEVKYPWGTPLTEQELKAIGFQAGDSVSMFEGGVGTILNIKRYDIDGGTVLAEVEDKDGKRSFTNVRVLKHS